MGSFAVAIDKFITKTGVRADLVLRKVALDAFSSLTMLSPVDKGRFRASWRVGVNAPDLSTEPERKGASGVRRGSPPTQTELDRANGKIGRAKFGATIHITNDLPYARRLERGHSQQTSGPNNILGLTLQTLRAEFERAVRELGT